MNILPHILDDIGIRDIDEKIGDLQALFSELSYSHLPVGREGTYVGCISENDAQTFEEQDRIGDYQYALEGFYVRDSDDWLEVLDTFAQNDTNLLPVLDQNNSYLGYVELTDIVSCFTETPFLNDRGGIVILEKGYKDYSFSEISQIIESNDAQVLGAFLSKLENDLAQITVKINQTGLNSILQSFRRYGYKIISHHQEDSFENNLQERSRYLDKYLNV